MDTTTLYQQALLSEAAYADLENINTQDEYEAALIASGLSPAQVDEFITNWRVISHQPNTDSGFSATLFQRITADLIAGYKIGDFSYAVRGTEFAWNDFVDLNEDIGNIVQDDLALEQIVDLYNDWIRITTPQGQAYQVANLVYFAGDGDPSHVIFDGSYKTIKFTPSTTFFASDDSRYTGAGHTITSEKLTSVTGHSLGGHLASAFTRLFPSLTQAYTINGAGFGSEGNHNGVDTNVHNLFGLLNGGDSFGDIQNIFGDKNPEIVTQDGPLLFQPGNHDAVFIEKASFDELFGHGVAQMTDSLAVYDLFIRLDSELAEMTPTDIFAGLSPVSNKRVIRQH